MSAVNRACSTPSRRGIGWVVVYLVMDNYGTDKTELGQELAHQALEVPRPLHPDLGLLARPSGAVVCHTDPAMHPSRYPSLHAPIGAGHPSTHRHQQRQPQAVHLVEDRRRQRIGDFRECRFGKNR